MLAEYWHIIVLCFSLLFLKSFAYGNFLRLRISKLHNNKYFKKHKSKNFFINYFYFGYFKELNKMIFIINLLLPIISFLLFIIESIVFIVNLDILFPLGNICLGVATFLGLFSFVFAMIYSWCDSNSNIILTIFAIIIILMPIFSLFFQYFYSK